MSHTIFETMGNPKIKKAGEAISKSPINYVRDWINVTLWSVA